MYMAMALALKYNYTRRLATYQENLVKGNVSPATLPTMAENLGYDNATNSSAVPADLKMSWNLLDLSSLVYQNGFASPEIAAQEQSRKVVNNILQETRTLYWKALASQRLIPVIDDMNEYLVRVVDELNARSNEMIKEGKTPSTNLLLKKGNIWKASSSLPICGESLIRHRQNLPDCSGCIPQRKSSWPVRNTATLPFRR